MMFFKLKILTGTLALVYNFLIDVCNVSYNAAQRVDKLIDELEQYEVWF